MLSNYFHSKDFLLARCPRLCSDECAIVYEYKHPNFVEHFVNTYYIDEVSGRVTGVEMSSISKIDNMCGAKVCAPLVSSSEVENCYREIVEQLAEPRIYHETDKERERKDREADAQAR